MKQHKAMIVALIVICIVALIVICITAVVAALVTRKDLCEVHIRTGQTEVAVFTADGGCCFHGLRIRVRATAGGSDPRHFTGARISSTHPGFYPGLPTGRLLGRLASQVVKKLLHAIKEAL